MKNKNENEERFFSIELRSKAHIKNVTLTEGSADCVLLEGTLGELASAAFAEGEILEVIGSKGVLRINLGENEIKKSVEQKRTGVENP